MLKHDDLFLISDWCVNCAGKEHTMACHDIYREQPWPCIIAGCDCKEFTPPNRTEN